MMLMCLLCLGSIVEDEFVHDYSAVVSWHLVGREVDSGSPCISVCLNTACADATLPSTSALH